MTEPNNVNKWPDCGFSGAQVGAAKTLAAELLCLGPRETIDKYPKDRRIMVSKAWPHDPYPVPGGNS